MCKISPFLGMGWVIHLIVNQFEYKNINCVFHIWLSREVWSGTKIIKTRKIWIKYKLISVLCICVNVYICVNLKFSISATVFRTQNIIQQHTNVERECSTNSLGSTRGGLGKTQKFCCLKFFVDKWVSFHVKVFIQRRYQSRHLNYEYSKPKNDVVLRTRRVKKIMQNITNATMLFRLK